MKKIIPFKKEIIFNDNLSEITSISLEHNLKSENNEIVGNFYITGEYKVTRSSQDTLKFDYDLPFEIDLDETEYTMQMYCLGKYYNYALICIETNYSTYPVKKLYEMDYTNQYLRTIDEGIDVKVQDKLGFNTNKATRPVIISELKEFFEECIELINDKKTLKEALTFIKRSDGKQAADDGYHDDRIMSLAIANKARTQQTYLIEQTPEENKTNLPFALQDEISDDNLDDYEENGYGLEW